MPESEQPSASASSVPESEAVPDNGPAEESPGPDPIESTPSMPDHAPPVPAPVGSRWSQLSRATVLLFGVGLGAAAVGAGWLTTVLYDSETDPSDHSLTVTEAEAEVAAGTESFTTDGTITLPSVGAALDNGGLCSGTGGYSDIDFGTQVNITDAAGTLVAHGSLGLGEKTDAGCTFPFTVDDVTPGSNFYTVEVSHRGGLTQTETDLRAGGLAFTLGD
ncbi:hypothetical protein OHB02_19025 [Streptomyces albidoflavus]|uniref:hypothetical protein n=1 Tax=Streptomyces TaxID=1883 RepID=UPI001E429048|nr:hypothetical protein [Streptomyces sp. OUCMDZ-3434]WSB22156.1 hypothetical protein OHB02_19025 [Streptomyces albidoflavus]